MIFKQRNMENVLFKEDQEASVSLETYLLDEFLTYQSKVHIYNKIFS